MRTDCSSPQRQAHRAQLVEHTQFVQRSADDGRRLLGEHITFMNEMVDLTAPPTNNETLAGHIQAETRDVSEVRAALRDA